MKKKDKKLLLNVEKRIIKGKKVKKLRREGFIPANIFGKKINSMVIKVKHKDFREVYNKAKRTSVIYIQFGEKELPVLVNEVQYHPVTQQILHVEFKKVDLTVKTQAYVPVVLKGESEAVTQKGAEILTPVRKVLVEALPTDIPNEIELDVTMLKNIGDEIKVKDIKKNNKYSILEEEDKILAVASAHKKEEEKMEKVEEEEVTTEKTEEGEKKEEENKEEKKENKEEKDTQQNS